MFLAATTTDASAQVTADVLIVVAIVGYWVPAIVGLARKMPNRVPIILVNVFAGWTGVGWLVALVMACWSKPQPPQYVVPPGWQPVQPGTHPGTYYGPPEGYR